MKRFLPFLLAAAACLCWSGCLTLKYGRAPATERIEAELVPRVSTKADVLRVLGAPRGYGNGSLSALRTDRVIWFYELTTANQLSGEIRFKFLLVFFDAEKFDGYLWFSSLEGAPSIAQRKK